MTLPLLWSVLGLMTCVALGFVLIPWCRKKHNATQWIFLLTLVLAFPLVAFTWYSHYGASEPLAQKIAIEKAHREFSKLGSMAAVVARMETLVKQHPDDPKGWYYLGRLYFSEQHYQQSEKAFSQAEKLAPNNLDFQMGWIEANFMAHGGQLSETSMTKLNKIVKKYPNQVSAKNLLAVDAFQAGHYGEAIAYWQDLLKVYAPQSEDYKALEESISKARALLVNRDQ